RRVTTGQFTPISEQAIRPSRRLQAIIERTMSLDPKNRYRDMRALGQELLTLAGQRTRITWGLSFGEVAAAVRAHHARELDEEAIALAQTRAPKRHGRVSAWPLLAAACVGIATVAAFSLSNRQGPPASEAAPAAAPALAAASPGMVVRPLEPPPTSAGSPEGARSQPEAAAPSAGSEGPADERDPAGAATRAPERAAARTDGARASEASDEAEDNEPPPRPRARPRPRPRAQPRVLEAPPPEPPRELPETPEWIIERSVPRARSPRPSPVQMGTNDAPIFE